MIFNADQSVMDFYTPIASLLIIHNIAPSNMIITMGQHYINASNRWCFHYSLLDTINVGEIITFSV